MTLIRGAEINLEATDAHNGETERNLGNLRSSKIADGHSLNDANRANNSVRGGEQNGYRKWSSWFGGSLVHGSSPLSLSLPDVRRTGTAGYEGWSRSATWGRRRQKERFNGSSADRGTFADCDKIEEKWRNSTMR